MLAHGLAVLIVQIRKLLLDDLAHANLGQFLRHQLLAGKQTLLQRRFVLYEGRHQFVQILAADPFRLLALRLGQPLDLQLQLSCCRVVAHVGFVRIVSTRAVVEAGCRAAVRVLRLEFETRSQHLLHEKARRNGLERVVHRLGDRLLAGIGFGDEIGETGSGLSFRVTRRPADNLDDLGQA